MKVAVEKIDAHKRVLEIEVPQPEVAKAIDRAYQRLANKVNIPGFRKGKVPRKVLEMRLGKEALLDEAFELLAPQAYSEALKEQDIDPVGRPEIEVVTLEEDQPFVFKATVVAKPELTLGDYKDLKIKKAVAEVNEEDVNKQLENLRNRQAKMVVVEDAAIQNGDFAIIDFEGFIDGEPFKGGEGKGYPLEIGSGSFIPGFEEQLIGAKAGEEREVKVPFPADYHAEELAGKDSVFKVKINDVKRKELPELDDEFVKDIGEFNTLEELKTDIENKLKEAAEQKVDRDFRTQVIKTAVDNATVDIPEIMVETQIDNILQDMDVNLQNRGMSLAKYMEYTKTDVKSLRENYREAASFNVKTDLLLEAVAKAEGLEVTGEDLEQEVAAMAASYQAPVDEVRKIIAQEGRIEALAGSVLRKKAAKLIVDSAVAE